MAVLDKERALAVNAFFSDGKKEVLGVHVLVNQMKPPLLRSHALALAPFDKARIRVLAFFPGDLCQGIMAFLDMDFEKMICGEVLATLNTSVCMKLVIVSLVVAIVPEPQRFLVRGQ